MGYEIRSPPTESESINPIVGTPIYRASFKAIKRPLTEKKITISGDPPIEANPFRKRKRRAFFGFCFGQIYLLS